MAGGAQGRPPGLATAERRWTTAIMGATFVLLCVACLLTLLWFGQRALIYLPLGTVLPPEHLGLAGVESVSVPSSNGTVLQAWFIRAAAKPAQATLIVFNGNAGNRSYRAPFAAAMRQRGFNVLLFDYRGYGGSSGSPTEAGLFADARAIRAYVASRQDVDPGRLVLFGESLGTAVALDLAIAAPPMALVLRSPFTSLADVGASHYWFLPVRFLLRDRYDSLDRISALACPLIVIAGDRDGIVPYDLSRTLFDAAPEPKRFVTIPGADHNDAALVHGPAVVHAVLDVLDAPAR